MLLLFPRSLIINKIYQLQLREIVNSVQKAKGNSDYLQHEPLFFPIHSDKGLTLKTSALKLFTEVNLCYLLR